MKKLPSKVGHDRPRFFFSIANRPKTSPNLNCSPRNLCIMTLPVTMRGDNNWKWSFKFFGWVKNCETTLNIVMPKSVCVKTFRVVPTVTPSLVFRSTYGGFHWSICNLQSKPSLKIRTASSIFWIYLAYLETTAVCIIVRRLACLWSKMPMFKRAGMREGGEPLPLAFQYLILVIWRPCDFNLVMISSLA